jgi:thymidine kinase
MVFLTIKEMLTNFNLIERNGLDIKEEEEKNETKKYINKLISNMSQETNKVINDYNIISIDDCEPFTDTEKNALKKLLDKHHNRVIFLHKLNDYRTSSNLKLNQREFNILGELFSYLIDISKKEKDYHCVEMSIILSKTYYKLENDIKIYIQNLIKDNEYFKSNDFWEELLVYSVSKECMKSRKRNDDKQVNGDISSEDNSNIVFSQLLSLIDNMFDFGVDDNLIKEIIEPKIIFYNIDNNLRNTINDVIESKIKSKSNNNNEDKKKRER